MPERGRDRKAQTARLAGQQRESITLVETLCGFVLGIDYHGKHAQFGARRAHKCIAQEYTAETHALVTSVHGQAPQ